MKKISDMLLTTRLEGYTGGEKYIDMDVLAEGVKAEDLKVL